MFIQSRKFIDYASLISILLLTLLHQFGIILFILVILAGHEYYSTLK